MINLNYDAWDKYVHSEDLGRAKKEVDEIVRIGEDLNIEFRIIWLSGETRYIRAFGRVMQNRKHLFSPFW